LHRYLIGRRIRSDTRLPSISRKSRALARGQLLTSDEEPRFRSIKEATLKHFVERLRPVFDVGRPCVEVVSWRLDREQKNTWRALLSAPSVTLPPKSKIAWSSKGSALKTKYSC
jgi:hypothetical protein